jgi:aquaporin Z
MGSLLGVGVQRGEVRAGVRQHAIPPPPIRASARENALESGVAWSVHPDADRATMPARTPHRCRAEDTFMSRRSRIFVAELIGTLILVVGGPGTVIFGQFLGFNIGVLGVALAFGLSLLCAAYLFGHISGCHINPAVTVGMWALKRTDSKDVPAYFAGQIIGAALGGFMLWAILAAGDNAGKSKFLRQALFGHASNGFADHSPGKFGFWAVAIAEVLFTALFILVIAGTTRSSAIAGFAGIPIGLMLALIHMISIPIDNTSVNPARSFATALFSWKLDDWWALKQLWVFILFPVIGGLIGALIWRFVTTPEDEGAVAVA